MKCKVIIADDHALFTEGLTKIINDIEGFEVVACANNGENLLKLLNGNYKPDLLILDVCMPQLNGIEAGKKVRASLPNCKILVCTMYSTKTILQQVEEFKPQGLISKYVDAGKLEEVLNTILSGKTYFETEYQYKDSSSGNVLKNDAFHLLLKLTEREKQVISLSKQGLSPKAIAVKLELSINTINNHKANIYQKLGFSSATELIKFAYDHNL